MIQGEVKISELDVLTSDGSELIPVIQSDGMGGYINGALPVTAFGGSNMANADLTLTADRSHALAGFNLVFSGGGYYTFDSSIAPSGGNASFNIGGFGTVVADVVTRVESGLGTIMETYGDQSTRIFGKLGVNTAATTTAQAYFFTNTLQEAILGEGSNIGFRGVGGSTGVVGQAPTGTGVSGSGSNGAVFQGTVYGVVGFANTGGGYFYSNGGGYGAILFRNPGSAGSVQIDGLQSWINQPTYANNADALAGGLAVGDIYKTATGEVRIVI